MTHPFVKDNPARETLTKKCVKVIVENFERLPAHDATRGSDAVIKPKESDDGEEKKGRDIAGARKRVSASEILKNEPPFVSENYRSLSYCRLRYEIGRITCG